MAVEGTVSVVHVNDEKIYFVFKSKSGRIEECAVEYNEETDSLVIITNKRTVGII